MEKKTSSSSRPRGLRDDFLKEEVKRCADVIKRGGIVLYPTDTVWGIGCDASNPEAVAKVFALKERADHKAMIILVGSADDVEIYTDSMPDVARQLIEFSEKPLTIVYDNATRLAPQLLGEDGSVGIRVTSEAFSNALCRQLRRPLVSTSANISGRPAPAIFKEIAPEIIEGVDYVVDYRRDDTSRSLPSTVMKISAGGEFRIIRP